MYSWKDKLIDWANRQGVWTRIFMAVGITMLIVAIILGVSMPSKGVVNTNKVDIGQVKNTMDDVVDGLATKASQSELDDFSEAVSDTLDEQSGNISGLGVRMDDAETGLGDAQTNIIAIQGDLAELACTPPEGYLAGAFGNYTLHAKSNAAGSFVGKVHLVYSPGIGTTANYTAVLDGFYASVNWTVNATIPSYVPIVTFNGTGWGITEVWWNIGTFELAAKTEKTIAVTCAGLNSTWEPDFAYAEIYPVLK